MNLKKQILSFAVVLMPLFGASAQSSEALGFVRIHQNAARAALAGAGSVSERSSAWASFENPTARPYYADRFSVAAGFNSWAPSKSTYYAVAGAWKATDKLAINAGFLYGNGQAYDVYSSTGKKSGTFTPSSMLLNAGVAYEIVSDFYLGVNVHRASETLAEGHSYSAFSADVMGAYEFSGMKVAAGVVSIGQKVKSASGTEFSLPSSAKLAFGYEGCSLGILAYGAYLDADYFLSSKSVGASVGASVGYSDLVCLRAGYHYGSDKCVIPSYASVGLGASFYGLSLDFAYLMGGQISGTLMLGLGYRF